MTSRLCVCVCVGISTIFPRGTTQQFIEDNGGQCSGDTEGVQRIQRSQDVREKLNE